MLLLFKVLSRCRSSFVRLCFCTADCDCPFFFTAWYRYVHLWFICRDRLLDVVSLPLDVDFQIIYIVWNARYSELESGNQMQWPFFSSKTTLLVDASWLAANSSWNDSKFPTNCFVLLLKHFFSVCCNCWSCASDILASLHGGSCSSQLLLLLLFEPVDSVEPPVVLLVLFMVLFKIMRAKDSFCWLWCLWDGNLRVQDVFRHCCLYSWVNMVWLRWHLWLTLFTWIALVISTTDINGFKTQCTHYMDKKMSTH